MNRLVRERYPVSKLPEDLREGFHIDANVRVTVDVEPNTTFAQPSAREDVAASRLNATPKQGLFSRYKHLRRENFKTDEEVDAYVDALRNEWSDRER